MNRIILYLCLAIIPGDASASDWRQAASGANRTFYIDASSITPVAGGWTKVWIKVDDSADKTVKYSYSIERWAFNCANHTVSIGAATYYRKSGMVIASDSSPTGVIEIKPDSVAQEIETFVCKPVSN